MHSREGKEAWAQKAAVAGSKQAPTCPSSGMVGGTRKVMGRKNTTKAKQGT